MVLDRICHAIVVLVIIEALVANVDALLKAVVLRNDFAMAVTRLIVIAQVVHLLVCAAGGEACLVRLELLAFLVDLFSSKSTVDFVVVQL